MNHLLSIFIFLTSSSGLSLGGQIDSERTSALLEIKNQKDQDVLFNTHYSLRLDKAIKLPKSFNDQRPGDQYSKVEIIPFRFGHSQPDLAHKVESGDIAVYFNPSWTKPDYQQILINRMSHASVLTKKTDAKGNISFQSSEIPNQFSRVLNGTETKPFHIFRLVNTKNPKQKFGANISKWAAENVDRIKFELEFGKSIQSFEKYYQSLDSKIKSKKEALHCSQFVLAAINRGYQLTTNSKAVVFEHYRMIDLLKAVIRNYTGPDLWADKLATTKHSDLITQAKDTADLFGYIADATLKNLNQDQGTKKSYETTVLNIAHQLQKLYLKLSLAKNSADAKSQLLTITKQLDTLRAIESSLPSAKVWAPPHIFMDQVRKEINQDLKLIYVGTAVHEQYLVSKEFPLRPELSQINEKQTNQAIAKATNGKAEDATSLWKLIKTELPRNQRLILELSQSHRLSKLEKNEQLNIAHNNYSLSPGLFSKVVISIWNDPKKFFHPSITYTAEPSLKSIINNLRVSFSNHKELIVSESKRKKYSRQDLKVFYQDLNCSKSVRTKLHNAKTSCLTPTD